MNSFLAIFATKLFHPATMISSMMMTTMSIIFFGTPVEYVLPEKEGAEYAVVKNAPNSDANDE